MGEDVNIDGMKLPWGVMLAVLTFTFWLGGLSIAFNAMADDQKAHEAEPAHAEAALATNTIQADVKHNVEEIAEVKEEVIKVNNKLDKLEEQMAEDKNEILDAIRSRD